MIEPFDIGYPDTGFCHIGLYQPHLNRVLLTLCDVGYARDIVLLASNRYSLFMVNLASADNYRKNLIDNHCCENWAIPNEQILQTTISNYANVIVNAKHLIEHRNNIDFTEEKQYLQLCYYYIKLLDYISVMSVKAWQVKVLMADIFDYQDQQVVVLQNLKKQVMAELFLAKHIDSARESIETILAKAKKDHDLVF